MEGTPEQRNMYFFTKIIQSLRLNYKQVSELTGYSQQLISWWIVSDDCKLSNIVKLFEKLGIRIECYYTPLDDSPITYKAQNFDLEIDGNLPKIPGAGLYPAADAFAEILSNCVRLRWLADFIMATSTDLNSFCTAMEYNYFTIYQMFLRDDIKMSRIYDIARKTHQKVNWKLTALASDEGEQK